MTIPEFKKQLAIATDVIVADFKEAKIDSWKGVGLWCIGIFATTWGTCKIMDAYLERGKCQQDAMWLKYWLDIANDAEKESE